TEIKNPTLFGLALQAVIFIYTIGVFLLYRWFKTGKNVRSTLLWSLAFLCYGSTFIGMVFQSLGYVWADMKVAGIFFLYRQTMIWWIALMYVGTASVVTNSRKKQIIPAVVFFALGYAVFITGLLVVGDIDYTMYILLYSFWTPLCAAITYIFYLYGRDTKFASPKIIAIGFALLGITYLAWSPWHKVAFYYIWFFLFNVSIAIILLGYVLLPYEIKAKENASA
nr:hypothetical protein [Candidatus Sigynarchaeota archaeon]